MADGQTYLTATAGRAPPSAHDLRVLSAVAERVAPPPLHDAGTAHALVGLVDRVLRVPPRGKLELGDRAALAWVVEGSACRHRHLQDGTRRIVALCLPGDAILPGGEADGLAALSACRVAVVPGAALVDLRARRPGVEGILSRLAAREARLSREWLVNAGRPAPRRIAHLLCEILDRTAAAPGGGAAAGDVGGGRITQADLADMVHTSHVHLNRALRTLAQAGLVRCERRRLSVPDPARLAAYAGYDPAYLRDDTGPAAGPMPVDNARPDAPGPRFG